MPGFPGRRNVRRIPGALSIQGARIGPVGYAESRNGLSRVARLG